MKQFNAAKLENIEADGFLDKSAGGQQAKEITLNILKDKNLF